MRKTDKNQNLDVKKIEKILELQRYPTEAEAFLKRISKESAKTGWPYIVIKAYNFGVIIGKKRERYKKIV